MNPEARADVACVIGCVQPNVSICATVPRAAVGFVGYLRSCFPRGSGTFSTCHVACEARSQITHAL